MKFEKAVALAVSLAACFALSSSQETCTRQLILTPVQNFSMDGVLGVWMNWNTYYPSAEDVDKTPIYCWRANIVNRTNPLEPYDMGIIEGYNNNSTGDFHQNFTFFNRPGEDVPSPAIWERYTKEPNDTYVRSDSVYVNTDYETYALQYVCAVKDNRLDENMIVWTRDRHPDPELITVLEALVEGYGFPLENRRPIYQSDCEHW